MSLFLKNSGCGKGNPELDGQFSSNYYIAHMHDKQGCLLPICFCKCVIDVVSCGMFSALFVSIDFQEMSSGKNLRDNVSDIYSVPSHRVFAALERNIHPKFSKKNDQTFFCWRRLGNFCSVVNEFFVNQSSIQFHRLKFRMKSLARYIIPCTSSRTILWILLSDSNEKYCRIFSFLSIFSQNGFWMRIFLSIINPGYFDPLDFVTSLFISAKRNFCLPKKMLVVSLMFRFSLFLFQPVL